MNNDIIILVKEFYIFLSNIVIYRALFHVEHGEKTKRILWGIVGNFKELIRGDSENFVGYIIGGWDGKNPTINSLYTVF